MNDFLIGAGGMAAGSIIVGVTFLYLTCVKYWRHGGTHDTFSPTLARVVTLLAIATPVIVYMTAPADLQEWSLLEVVVATLATWVVLRMYIQSARRDAYRRIRRQKGKKS